MVSNEGFFVLFYDEKNDKIMRLLTAYSPDSFNCSRQEMLEYFNLLNRTSHGVKVSFYKNEHVEFTADSYLDDGIYYTDIFLEQARALTHCVKRLFELTDSNT